MHSIKSKIITLTAVAIIVVITISTAISAVAIRNLGNSTSAQILFLVCEEGQKNLNAYFRSVEQSVETISSYAEADLASSASGNLADHLSRVEKIFEKTANQTYGILTYYYRIDPEISVTDKGFWYVNLSGTKFEKHEVTDITLYDTNDQSNLVWFTVPKTTDTSVWLPPYFTDNLDVYVLSYNVPIHKNNKFIGVIGIEIDFNTIAEPVKNISLYNNGYAFINDANGNIIYHPKMDNADYTSGKQIKVPDGLLLSTSYIKYHYNGIDKQAVWLPLDNGMRLNVTVPTSEINAGWIHLIQELVITSLLLLLIFLFLTMRFVGHITSPLQELTETVAQVDQGNYDFKLDYNKDDEVGTLTNAFRLLLNHLKV